MASHAAQTQGLPDIAGLLRPRPRRAFNEGGARSLGASSNLFHQGFAKEADDDDIIAAAMAKPGIVLKRPVGSSDPFREDADLPTAASLDLPRPKRDAKPKAKAPKLRKTDEMAERRAAVAFEKEQQKRQKQREKEEAEAAKARAKREAAREKAEAALETAKRGHEGKAAEMENDLAAVQRRAEAEEERWQELKERLQTELRKASR